MNFIRRFYDEFDPQWLKEHILNLYHLERNQTFPYYQKAAKYVYDLLCHENFDSELIHFPADGKTVYQDKCMPIGWDANQVRLEVISKIPGLKDPVIADFAREPLSIVKHSVSTPPGGITTRVVTENQMKSGDDVTGAFVLLNPSSRPIGQVITTLLDLGAIGWISDYHEEGLNQDIDAVYWCNAGTEYGNWHITAEDREYISFQISPKSGFYLRAACEKGMVIVRAVSDAHRYQTTLPAVTALLPGEDKKELWVISHLYEPLIDDNSNGVIGSIAILKTLRKLRDEGAIRLKYSVRLVFASEMYGTAAVAEYFGGDLSKQCIGAINTDGTTGSTDKSVYNEYNIVQAPNLPGFVGNIVMDSVCDKFLDFFPETKFVQMGCRFIDDMFLSEPTTGLPTVWYLHTSKGKHHHSSQDEDSLDIESVIKHLSLHAEWIRAMTAATHEEVVEMLPAAIAKANNILADAACNEVRSGTDKKARLAFLRNREQEKIRGFQLFCNINEIEESCQQIILPDPKNPEKTVSDAWLQYCENFIFTRTHRGFPKDLTLLPKEKHFTLPAAVIYGKFADTLARMDGTKSLRQILTEIEWDLGIIFDNLTVKEYLHAALRLSEAGYLRVKITNELTDVDLSKALRNLGVKDGDTLLVHSSLSNIGYISGGADSVIDALLSAVGDTGTILAPAFTRPYIYFEGSGNKGLTFRPYDTRPDGNLRDKMITTGALPKAMLCRENSARSGHVSHEWVAIGANAAECVAGHDLLDDPASNHSPMKKALDRNGSVVFVGCDVKFNTFIHYIEHMADAAFLSPALVAYLDENGYTQTAYIRKHLGGCRDFYKGVSGRFYQKALQMGLKIYETPFGMTTLYRIELQQLYDIGYQIYKEDAISMLCQSETCPFCNRYNRRK